MAGLPQFLISTQTDPYWEIPLYDKDGNPLSVEGRVFEAWIAPAETKAGVAQPPAEIKVLTFQDGLSLLPPTDGSGDQTKKNTFVHQVSRAFAQANFPRGELTADLLEVVDGARRMFAPVRLFYGDPAQIRDFIADRQGITFGQGRQAIITPVAIAGQAGRRGSGLLTGTLPPQPSDGEDGDYWVVEREGQANVIYGPKEGGEWPAQPSSTFGVGGVADVLGLPEVIEGTVKRDANLGDLTNKDQARETILAARKIFRQVGSDSDATLESEALSRFHTGQYPVPRDGSARAEDLILQQFRSGRITGRRFDLLSGKYLVSGLELDYRGLAGDFTVDNRGVPLSGEGKQNTQIVSALADAYAVKITGPALVYSGVRALSFTAAVPGAAGLHLLSLAFQELTDINFGGLSVALKIESVLSSNFTRLMFAGNAVGVVALRGSGFSDVNANRWVGCHFRLNRLAAYQGGPSSGAFFYAPVVEGNGTQGDLTTGGLDMVFSGAEGAVGLQIDGGYFEINKGGFDINLVNTSQSRIVHTIKGVYFGRISDTEFVKNNIRSRGKNTIVLIGCVFEGLGTYVPDASRQYVDKDSDTIIVCIGCHFASEIERGDLRNVNDSLAAVMDRVTLLEAQREARIRVVPGTDAGTWVAQGLPAGWSFAKGGAGEFTIVHNLNRTDYVAVGLAATGDEINVRRYFKAATVAVFIMQNNAGQYADAPFDAIIKY